MLSMLGTVGGLFNCLMLFTLANEQLYKKSGKKIFMGRFRPPIKRQKNLPRNNRQQKKPKLLPKSHTQNTAFKITILMGR